LKNPLGLSDFRVRAYEAVDKYLLVVLLTWAYVERRFEQERSAQIKTYGDLIRRQRDEHAVEWLSGAMRMLQDTGDLQQVLEHAHCAWRPRPLKPYLPTRPQIGWAKLVRYAQSALRACNCLAGRRCFQFLMFRFANVQLLIMRIISVCIEEGHKQEE
jgi:hypothetical protein